MLSIDIDGYLYYTLNLMIYMAVLDFYAALKFWILCFFR